jgi:hypothetical protein
VNCGCGKATSSPDGEDNCKCPYLFTDIFANRFPLQPSLTVLATIVENFSSRKFTFEDDAFNAFAGVANALRTKYGSFHYGLPERFFDAAMLWQPSSRTPVSRRIAASDSPANANPQMPSWSWLGWRGSLDFSSWASCSAQRLQTQSLVKWDKYKVGERLKSLDHLLLSPKSDLSCTSIVKSPLLQFGADRAWLSLGEPNPISLYRGLHHTSRRSLKDDAGRMAGYIRLMPPEPLPNQASQAVGSEPTSQGPQHTECELIAISYGLIQKRSDFSINEKDEIHGLVPTPGKDCYEFYNVLWITRREDGVAVRKGLGRVAKDVWQPQKKENIIVVLG